MRRTDEIRLETFLRFVLLWSELLALLFMLISLDVHNASNKFDFLHKFYSAKRLSKIRMLHQRYRKSEALEEVAHAIGSYSILNEYIHKFLDTYLLSLSN